MKSSLSCKDDQNAATTLESGPLCSSEDHRMRDGCPQSVSVPPTYCIRAVGVLRYHRESDDHKLNLTHIPQRSQSPTEYPVKCEYCGEIALPSLDVSWVEKPEEQFCCAQRQQLWHMLVKQKGLFEERCNLMSDSLTSEEERKTLHYQGRGRKDPSKFINGLKPKLGIMSGKSISSSGYLMTPSGSLTFVPVSGVLRFRLSCPPENTYWTLCASSITQKCLKIIEEEFSLPFYDERPVQFGLYQHQMGSGFQQRFYSNGVKFLTRFPDGSAQVFYPSGLLAVLVVVTEHNGRVCIVYDDISAPNQPIRALFQSDGKATCFHSNGNIWLSLNASGGLRLNDAGATTCKWNWRTSTPLYPIFLSLNKTIGVRVLGNKQVFVSFLAYGQQAKFSVGTCCAQDEYEPTSGSSVLKEELLAQAAKIHINLVMQHLHQCLMAPFNPRKFKAIPTPHQQVVSQRLLEISADVMMSDSDRSFICRCLQDC